MSEKDCGHHSHRKKFYRLLLAALLALIILILFILLLTWLILRPKNPHFVLQDATLYSFNVSSSGNLLNSNLQITLSSYNPNHRAGIYYDNLGVYATYRNQQISFPIQIPATYQGHRDVTLWSPFLYGDTVPVAPYVGESLDQDRTAGSILINFVVYGKLRWKVGGFISRRYHLNVKCPAFLKSGANNNGFFAVGPDVKFQLVQKCSVQV